MENDEIERIYDPLITENYNRFLLYCTGYRNKEDIVQDACLRMRELLKRDKGPVQLEHFIGWALNVVKHVRQEYSAQVKREYRALNRFVDICDALPDYCNRTHIKVLVKNMIQPYGRALDLVYIKGINPKQAAKLMDVSYGNFRVILNRARKKFKQLITALGKHHDNP